MQAKRWSSQAAAAGVLALAAALVFPQTATVTLRGVVKGLGSDLRPEGGEDEFLSDGVVYALSGEGSTVLGTARLLRSPAGRWEIANLPAKGPLLLIGFAQSRGPLYWTFRADPGGRALVDLRTQFAIRADNLYKGSDRSVFLSDRILGTLIEAGWLDRATFRTHTDAQRLDLLAQALAAKAGGAPPAAGGALTFTRVPPAQVLIGDPIAIEWTAPRPDTRVRYKLDMPGDWLGGIQYALNKWSDYETVRSFRSRGYVLEGNYTFTVETLDGQRISTRFRMRFEPPEVYEEAVKIDWAAIRRAPTPQERYRLLAAEYEQACAMWTARFEQEHKVLKLTADPQHFIGTAWGAVMDKALDDLKLIQWERNMASAAVGKALDAQTLYDIARNVGLDAVLIWRNARANRASFSAIAACRAAAGYRKLAGATRAAPVESLPPGYYLAYFAGEKAGHADYHEHLADFLRREPAFAGRHVSCVARSPGSPAVPCPRSGRVVVGPFSTANQAFAAERSKRTRPDDPNLLHVYLESEALYIPAAPPARTHIDSPTLDAALTGWSTFVAGWRAEDGILISTNRSPGVRTEAIWNAGAKWRDYEVSAQINMREAYAPSDAKVLLRYRSPDSYVGCGFLRDYSMTYLRLDSPGQPDERIPFRAQVGEWYPVRATASGSTFACEVVGTNARVTRSYPHAQEGAVGFRNAHIEAWFGALAVKALDGGPSGGPR